MSVLLSVGEDTSSYAVQEELVLEGDSAFLQRHSRVFPVSCTGARLSLTCCETVGYVLY